MTFQKPKGHQRTFNAQPPNKNTLLDKVILTLSSLVTHQVVRPQISLSPWQRLVHNTSRPTCYEQVHTYSFRLRGQNEMELMLRCSTLMQAMSLFFPICLQLQPARDGTSECFLLDNQFTKMSIKKNKNDTDSSLSNIFK